MAHTLVPVNIRPHLIPFLFKELRLIELVHEGASIKAAKVTNNTALGVMLRLLLEKSNIKPDYDKSLAIFLQVQEDPQIHPSLKGVYRLADGRSSYLILPEAGETFLNRYLENNFDTACMFYINSWHEKRGPESIDQGIVKFFEKYNLEEFNYNIPRIRRDYYRKLSNGYFEGKVQLNPINSKVEIK